MKRNLVLFLSFLGAFAYGWINNIVSLFSVEVWTWTGQTIISLVGIPIAPLGAILGLFVW